MAVIRGSNISVEGLSELESQFARIGKMKKKYLNKAAKEGINPTLEKVKAAAPRGKTGMLKRGIQKKMETPNHRNKSVYRMRWNPKYAEAYQKPSSGAYGGEPPKAFYPYSQEYGFLNKSGQKTHTKWYHFASNVLKQEETSSAERVVKSLSQSIDEIIRGV
jgi:Bacteriophage HK97-gp10, putative tail-component